MRAKKVPGPTGDLVTIKAGASEIELLVAEVSDAQNQYVRNMITQLAQVLAGPVEVPKPRAPKA